MRTCISFPTHASLFVPYCLETDLKFFSKLKLLLKRDVLLTLRDHSDHEYPFSVRIGSSRVKEANVIAAIDILTGLEPF